MVLSIRVVNVGNPNSPKILISTRIDYGNVLNIEARSDYLIFASLHDGLANPGVTAFPKGAIGFDETLEMLEYSTSLALHHMSLAGYDVSEFFLGTSSNIGLGLVTIIGILALAGGSLIIYKKSNVKKSKKISED